MHACVRACVHACVRTFYLPADPFKLDFYGKYFAMLQLMCKNFIKYPPLSVAMLLLIQLGKLVQLRLNELALGYT